MRFCIHVVDDDENSCYGEKISVHFDEGGYADERTDNDGNAFFECDEEDNCSFDLYIGNHSYGSQTAEDGESLTFTIDEGVGTFKWTIHVIKGNDKPAYYIEVGCHFSIWRGFLNERTDEDGNAEFKIHTSRQHETIQIYVDGEDQGEHTIEDGDSLTFSIANTDDEDRDDEDEELSDDD